MLNGQLRNTKEAAAVVLVHIKGREKNYTAQFNQQDRVQFHFLLLKYHQYIGTLLLLVQEELVTVPVPVHDVLEWGKHEKHVFDVNRGHNLMGLFLDVECNSEYNTPILPLKKADGKSYRLDLKVINKIVEDLYPVVANPYTLLTKLKDNQVWFTILDLKDAFFCLALAKNRNFLLSSGKILIQDEEPSSPGQFSHRVLRITLQCLQNQLARDLKGWSPPMPKGFLLQYLEDLLIATETEEDCLQWTVNLLNFPGLNGFLEYKVILVEQDDVNIVTANNVNPASFFSEAAVTLEPGTHDCLETIKAVYSSQLNLKEELLEDAVDSWFTDGSNFVRAGTRKAGYAVTTAYKVMEEKPLPAGT
ncbi:endogenous retrovirus group K member 25 Pol protein-like [Pitangus sulphuratus]|nr:endogenous retrovirus group K member 25 Pol protein-like [Pitangus sulphuratus]